MSFWPQRTGKTGWNRPAGGQNVHRGQTKIGLQGLVGGLGNDLGMTNRVRAVLIHPWVQGGHIHITYFLPFFSHGMQSHRTGATPFFDGFDQLGGAPGPA